MNEVLIDKRADLLKYKEQILTLFKICFEGSISDELWTWFYIDNPNGNPIVSLFFDDEVLVGHYAVIPLSFIFQQKSIKGLLSMTTMVHPQYQGRGFFLKQANFVYEEAMKQGYQFVCGFPNKNSAPGFKNRLEWTLEEDLYVASFSYSELQKIKKITYPNSISFNTQDKNNIDWRLRKPNQNYFIKNNSILKSFNDTVDIVFNGIDFSGFDREKRYNILLDHELDKYLDKKEFNYIFGYRFFDASLDGIEFKKDLIMSDVF